MSFRGIRNLHGFGSTDEQIPPIVGMTFKLLSFRGTKNLLNCIVISTKEKSAKHYTKAQQLHPLAGNTTIVTKKL